MRMVMTILVFVVVMLLLLLLLLLLYQGRNSVLILEYNRVIVAIGVSRQG